MPHTTITNLPTDVLSCIVRRLQHDAWQDETLADIAALRSVCRPLRHAVDVNVNHARFHPHIDIEALRNVTRRCTGNCHPAPSIPYVGSDQQSV
jgi:F-box domain